MNLSKNNLSHITNDNVVKPSDALFTLPEKVLQFGTGVLLRGLPDYFIDKANRQGIFKGRVVVVKSTDTGDTTAFNEQDGLYTLCIRGIQAGKKIEENIICSAISRVLSAKQQWDQILKCAHSAELQIIISNTTEVGIQLVKESIFQQPPVSFPAKLLAFLHERYKIFEGNKSAGMVILPTELITDNGKKLQLIITELAQFNNLDQQFTEWISSHNYFCNTLVDCIVPGKPEIILQKPLEKELGYDDDLITMSEVYRLWAIEGDDQVRSVLSFAEADERIIVTPDIEKYKELKLRLLNATHTLTCGLAWLSGINTVIAAMESQLLSAYIGDLMLKEIAPAIPYALPAEETNAFSVQVLERFSNPHIQHKWLSITMQYSSKLAMRAIPVLLHYNKLYKAVPEYFALGFAAYLLFMKPVKKEGDKFFGEVNGQLYHINDDKASYYFELWQHNSIENIIRTALQNEKLWNADLLQIDGFAASVNQKLNDLITYGAMQTLSKIINE